MRLRAWVVVSAAVAILFLPGIAHAQIGSSCLRPLGIPDKWIENQTPPWDPTDTFDPTGPTPDVYAGGYDRLADQGQPMSLVLYNRVDPVAGRSAWPVVVGEPGGSAFVAAIAGCSGWPHGIGESFELATGNLQGPFATGIEQLIQQDPDAVWDPSANGGRGGVINSAFAQSPRIIALPVFAPDSYASGTSMSPAMIKIVGFFVGSQRMERTTPVVDGYLTGWSRLEAQAFEGRAGEAIQLSATVTAPGSPVMGVPVEFLFDGRVVGKGETDGTGTARPPTTSFILPDTPGEFPGAIKVRLAEGAGFFVADEVTADLTIRRRLPVIQWGLPPDIVYGTPLGAEQLNATADVPGEFTYSPTAGTVLGVGEWQPITVTFVPYDRDRYDANTATTYVTVTPAVLVVKVNDAQKFYLDPLPAFSYTATGLVNGDTPAVVLDATSYVTNATAASEVGTYPVNLASAGAENYIITLQPGVLTVLPRPTTTTVQSSGPNPSTFGQSVTFTIAVSSGLGMPFGEVALLSGTVVIGTATLANGQASISAARLDAGSHQLTVRYAGAGGFASSTSSTITHLVNRANTTTQLTSSLNPSRTGQAVTFTATVNPAAPGAGVPVGSVQFLVNGAVAATVAANNGVATLTLSSLPVGKHAIQARYAGSANHNASQSAVLQQSVKGGGK